MLGASKGAMSQATRTLVALGLIERVPAKGSREAIFRMKEHAFAELSKKDMVRLRMLRELAEEGLQHMAHRSPESRARLQDFYDFYAFFERSVPQLVEQWLAEREEG